MPIDLDDIPASAKTSSAGGSSWTDLLGNAANDFFGKVDPRHPDPNSGLAPLGRQYLKAASLLVNPGWKALQGAGLATRALYGAMNAAPGAALMGASQSQTMNPVDLLNKATEGAITGSVVGGALPVAGQIASNARSGLERFSHKMGNLASRGYAGIMAKKVISPEAIGNAIDSGLIRAGDDVTNIAERAGAQADVLSSAKHAFTKDLDTAGVGINAKDAMKNIGYLVDEAKSKGWKELATAYENGISDIADLAKIHGDTIPLSAWESFKTNLGQRAKVAFSQPEGEASLAGKGLMSTYGKVRQAAEDAVGSQAPEELGNFLSQKKELSDVLSVAKASELGRAREFMRKIPLLQVMGTLGGGYEGYQRKGLGGMLGGAALGLTSASLAKRAPSTLAVLSRKLSQAPEALGEFLPEINQGVVDPTLAALAAYLRAKKEPQNAP